MRKLKTLFASGLGVVLAGLLFVSLSFSGLTLSGCIGCCISFPLDLFEAIWVQRFGGPGADSARQIGVGPDGSWYLYGTVEGDASFGDPESPVATLEGLASPEKTDFLAKYDAQHSIAWISIVAEPASQPTQYDMKMDVANDGSVVMSGNLAGSMTLAPEQDEATTIVGGIEVGDHHPYAASFGSDGHLRWAVVSDLEGWCSGQMHLVSNARLFWIGTVSGALSFAGEGEDLFVAESAEEETSLFMVEIDLQTGLALRLSEIGTSDEQGMLIVGGVADPGNGDLILSGSYKGGTVVLGKDGMIQTALLASVTPTYTDGFIARLEDDGDVVWVNTVKGAGDDSCESISRWGDDSLVLAGQVSEDGPVFGAENLAAEHLGTLVWVDSPHGPGAEGYLAKIDAATGAFHWVVDGSLRGVAPSIWPNGDVIVGGAYGGFTIDADGTVLAVHEFGFVDAEALSDGTVLLAGQLNSNPYTSIDSGDEIYESVGESDGYLGQFTPSYN